MGFGGKSLFGKEKKRETASERTQERLKETAMVVTPVPLREQPGREKMASSEKAEGREVEE